MWHYNYPLECYSDDVLEQGVIRSIKRKFKYNTSPSDSDLKELESMKKLYATTMDLVKNIENSFLKLKEIKQKMGTSNKNEKEAMVRSQGGKRQIDKRYVTSLHYDISRLKEEYSTIYQKIAEQLKICKQNYLRFVSYRSSLNKEIVLDNKNTDSFEIDIKILGERLEKIQSLYSKYQSKI